MKKTLFIFMTICLAFTLVCCDAESIAKTGAKLSKLKETSAGYASSVLVENLGKTIETAMEDSVPGENDVATVLEPETLEKVSNAILAASESTAGRAELKKLFGKKLNNGYHSLFTERPDVYGLLNNIDNLKNQVVDMVDSYYDDHESQDYQQVKNYIANTDKFPELVMKLTPAVDAIQSSLSQQYDRAYMSYGDYIAESLYIRTMAGSAINIILAEDKKAQLIEELSNLTNSIKVLEIIYDVSFDFPQLAANFLAD